MILLLVLMFYMLRKKCRKPSLERSTQVCFILVIIWVEIVSNLTFFFRDLLVWAQAIVKSHNVNGRSIVFMQFCVVMSDVWLSSGHFDHVSNYYIISFRGKKKYVSYQLLTLYLKCLYLNYRYICLQPGGKRNASVLKKRFCSWFVYRQLNPSILYYSWDVVTLIYIQF